MSTTTTIIRSDYDDPTATMLASIVQYLVDSGFMSAMQLGTLAQVSRDLNKIATGESVWAALCQRQYPVTAQIPPCVKESKGYRWLYRKWSTPIVERRPSPSPLAPPSCTSSELTFCIHIQYNAVPLFSTALSAKQLAPLMECGSVSIHLNNPIIIGEAEWDIDELDYDTVDKCEGLPIRCKDFDASKLHMSVHVYRDTDSAICTVYDSNDCIPLLVKPVSVHPSVQDGDTLTLKTPFDLSKPQSLGLLSLMTPKDGDVRAWPLRDTMEAAEVSLRLPYPVRLATALQCSVVQENKFGICYVTITAMEKNGDNGGSGSEFQSNQVSKTHGVTLLHILSELQGN